MSKDPIMGRIELPAQAAIPPPPAPPRSPPPTPAQQLVIKIDASQLETLKIRDEVIARLLRTVRDEQQRKMEDVCAALDAIGQAYQRQSEALVKSFEAMAEQLAEVLAQNAQEEREDPRMDLSGNRLPPVDRSADTF